LNLPLVSIGIPTFNQAQSVERAVAHALAQDYAQLEVVVADDDSKDDTRDVLARFAGDPRFRYTRNAHNLGRVANYRHLLRDLVRGAWVLMNDGDDYLTNTKYISKAIALIEPDPKIALVIAKVLKSGRDDEIMNARWTYPAIVDGDEFFLNHPPFGILGPFHLCALYNRDAALKLDFYRRDINPADFESLYRLMTGHRIGFVDEVVGVWSQHLENVTRNPDRRRLADDLELFDSLYRHAKTSGIASDGDLLRWYRTRLARAWLSGVKSLALRNRQPLAAAAFAYDVCKRDPLFWLGLPNAIRKIRGERA
jgi:glycosyltransferase involved in cell wall biosynthesis